MGGDVSPSEREDLYLAGLLSVCDELLGVPLPTLAASMPFSSRVLPALLHGQGETGLALRRVLEHERTDAEGDPLVATAWSHATAWFEGARAGLIR